MAQVNEGRRSEQITNLLINMNDDSDILVFPVDGVGETLAIQIELFAKARPGEQSKVRIAEDELCTLTCSLSVAASDASVWLGIP